MLVRFIAAALMGMSLVEFSLAWAEYHFRHVPVNVWSAVLWGIAFLAGIVMLAKAGDLARWIDNKLE